MELRNLRKKSGKTLQEVADDFKSSAQVISRYELNDRQLTPDLLIKFADYYNVSVDYLIGRKTKEGIEITGQVHSLTENEKEILKIFSELNEMQQQRCIGYASQLLEASNTKESRTITKKQNMYKG
jgi:transcriptional regulator with XRE-family HTH domain